MAKEFWCLSLHQGRHTRSGIEESPGYPPVGEHLMKIRQVACFGDCTKINSATVSGDY